MDGCKEANLEPVCANAQIPSDLALQSICTYQNVKVQISRRYLLNNLS